MSFSSFFRPQAARSQAPAHDAALDEDRDDEIPTSPYVAQLDNSYAPILSDDLGKQALLRQEIRDIQQDTLLDDKQKAALMQSLMTRNYLTTSHKEIHAAIQEVGHPLSAIDLTKTYHDSSANILGCPHYRRNCKLQ